MTSSVLSVLANLNPHLIVVVLGLAYLHRACTHWRWPLIVDPLLLALYAWRPSLGMLAFALALYAVRHVSALAREVVLLLKLDEYEGWTPRMVVFLLPALDAYRTAPEVPPLVAAPATGATIVLDVTDLPPLPAADWLSWANDDESAPHLGVIGPTRSGKTTFVLATLARRKGTLVITTPKAKDTDPWGGFPAVRLLIDLEARAVNWKPIACAIAQVHFEMLRRNAENTIAREDWLTLIIDEFGSTIAAAPEVRQHVLDLWLMGASSKIRLIVLAPEVNVKAWGIEGRGDAREICCSLGLRVTAVCRWAGSMDRAGSRMRVGSTRGHSCGSQRTRSSARACGPVCLRVQTGGGTMWSMSPSRPRLTRPRRRHTCRHRGAGRSRVTPRSMSCSARGTSGARLRRSSGSRARASTTTAGPTAMPLASTGATHGPLRGVRRLMVIVSRGVPVERRRCVGAADRQRWPRSGLSSGLFWPFRVVFWRLPSLELKAGNPLHTGNIIGEAMRSGNYWANLEIVKSFIYTACISTFAF
jgi:hypothetical protein